MERKTFEAKLIEKRENGGRIVISTRSPDRDRDRVFPEGAITTNYLANPVVQWGHNYFDPWATVGKTSTVEIGGDGIIADFELRPAANEQDPQNVVKLLWEGGWVRTASIGFNPIEWQENELGGRDFTKWELLEWSIVPIPANASALRLAAKALTQPEKKREAGSVDIYVNPDIDAEKVMEAVRDELRRSLGVAAKGQGQREPVATATVDDTAGEEEEGETLDTTPEVVEETTATVSDEPDEDEALLQAIDNFLASVADAIGGK